MFEMEEEYFFECPWCGEEISMLVDLTVPSQTYIEDCEVCCRPIQIHYQSSGREVEGFFAARS